MIKSFRMRKYLARALLPIVTLWLVFLPQRAYAFVPASIYAYPPVAAGGGAVAGTALGALAVGAAVGYYGLGLLADKFLDIPATDKEFSKKPAPDAPLTKNPQTRTFYFVDTFEGELPVRIQSDSGMGVCTQIEPLFAVAGDCALLVSSSDFKTSSFTDGFCVGTATVINVCEGGETVTSEGSVGPISVGSELFCSSGYELQNSICVLVDASLVPDGNIDVNRDANGYSPSVDPDSSPSDSDYFNDDGSVSVAGQNEQGQSQVVTVIPTPDGGSQVTTQTQEFDQNGSPSIWTQTVTVNGDGVVTDITGSYAPGTLPGSTVETGTSPTTGTSTSTTTGTTTVTTVDPITGAPIGTTTTTIISTTTETSTGNIQFPDDYARRGEAAASTKPIIDRLTKTSDLTDPTLPDVADMPTFDTTFDSLLSWQLPGHSSSCPSPTMDLGNFGSFTLNSHCALFEQHGQPLRSSMNVVWSVLALFIVLRA